MSAKIRKNEENAKEKHFSFHFQEKHYQTIIIVLYRHLGKKRSNIATLTLHFALTAYIIIQKNKKSIKIHAIHQLLFLIFQK